MQDYHVALLGLAVIVGAVWLFERSTSGVRNRNRARMFARLQAEDERFAPVEAPFGLGAAALAELAQADAPHGAPVVGWALQGPVTVDVGGAVVEVPIATLQLGWWRGGDEELDPHRTTVVAPHRSTTMAIAELPAPVPSRIVLGRPVTDGPDRGPRVESTRFNRSFRILSDDDRLALLLVDAELQLLLAKRYRGYQITLDGRYLVLTVRGERERLPERFLRDVPRLRRDTVAFLETVPQPFWRAIGAA